MLNKDSKDDESSDEDSEVKEKFFAKRWVKAVLGGIFTLVVLGLLAVYWFMPFSATQLFIRSPVNSNFNLNASNASLYEGMQFYPNMRYPSSNISYEINKTLCSLQKQNSIQAAFKRIENLTVLNFYPVNSTPQIAVSCDSKVIINKTYFVAGEGGPVNITQTGSFNVIDKGEVLLLRDSNCPVPNVATHELLHALGFAHSKNPNNVMYPVTSCDQTIGQDIPALVNYLYSFPSRPDLAVENVSAKLRGRYLDANVTIKNDGLVDANSSTLLIYAGTAMITSEKVPAMPIGSGITYTFTNLLASPNINQLSFNVLANFSELEKNNNEIELTLKG